MEQKSSADERERERETISNERKARAKAKPLEEEELSTRRESRDLGLKKTDKNPKFFSIKYLFLTENNGHNREKKKFKFDPRIYTHTERGKSL